MVVARPEPAQQPQRESSGGSSGRVAVEDPCSRTPGTTFAPCRRNEDDRTISQRSQRVYYDSESPNRTCRRKKGIVRR